MKTTKKVLAATVTFNRRWMVEEAISSWLELVPSNLWDLYVVDNNSEDGTAEWVAELARSFDFIHAILLDKNLGTAVALNLAWREAGPGVHRIKADSDIKINTPGFLERMITCMDELPSLGILGLRRDDLVENPYHKDPWYRSKYLDLDTNREIIHLEQCPHIMGSWQMYNASTTEQFGYLIQPGKYGFDDALASIRMSKLGFRNCFLRGWGDTSVSIEHLDPGEGDGSDEWNTEYTNWKRDFARDTMAKYREMADQYKNGLRSLYEGHNASLYEGHIKEVVL